MIESAVQNPVLIQTVGARVWLTLRLSSVGGLVYGFELTCDRWEEDGEDRQEDVGATHGSECF